MSQKARAGSAYAWFVVGILLLAYVFSFIDRQILSLLVGPIRKDLGISDTQMSLLLGFSFALFYTLCGIPIGRWADSGNRRGIIVLGMMFWSAMTAACGLAKSYGQLFLARVGVGVGEAALSPAAYSMITDYFPRESRATALSVYSMGIYIGSGLAYLVGGAVVGYASAQGNVELPIVGETRPWQVVFFILGIAGILASLAFVAVREPPRGADHAGAVPFGKVAAYLKGNLRTVLCHNVGFGLIAFAAYGGMAWVPSFLVRTYGWTLPQVGSVYGLGILVFGSAGIVFGGRLADAMLKRGRVDATLRVGLYAALACLPFGLAYPLVGNATVATVLMMPVLFFMAMPFGVAPAAIQEIVPGAMRGQASAVYLFVVNLIGLGLGPTGVALFTDYVFQDDAKVGLSLAASGTLALILAALTLSAGLRPYRESWARLHRAAT